MKKKIYLLFILLTLSAHAQVSVALFPLKNKTDDKLLDWIGYSVPEIFFRKLAELSGVQVWDPVFLFSVDSSGWQFNSDSLLLIHQTRWKWDYALGGSYIADGDSIRILLKAVKVHGSTLVSKRKKVRSTLSSPMRLFSDLFNDVLASVVQYSVSPEEKSRLAQTGIEGADIHTYATYAMGYGYEMQGRINSAITAYSRAIEMDASFPLPLYRISMLYSQSRKRKEAQTYLEKALARLPNSSLVAAQMAEFLVYSATPEKTIDFVNNHRQLLEKTAAGMKVIGMAYILSGEYQRAISVLTRARAAGPCDLETDFVLGRAYLSLRQFSTAAEIFGRLIKYRPRYTRYYSFLGESYREAGQLMESCNVLERAMVLDPDNVPNLINLSNTYFKLGWFDKAEQYLLRARALNPDLDEIALNLGVLYWHMGRKGDAEKMFAEAGKNGIHIQSSLNNQANILFLSGDVRKAIKVYRKAEKYGKRSEIILYNLARAYLAADKIKKAMAYLDEVLLLSPNRMDVIMMQADLAMQSGDGEKAELSYRKILDLSPGHREAMTALIELLGKQKKLEDAISIVEEYLRNFPQDLEYRLMLPDLYRRIGWYKVAIAEYENMLKDKDLQKSAQVYLGLGKSQYDIIRFKRGKNYEETIYTLKKASELDPDDPEPELIIGHIYMDYKKYRDLAIEHWQNAYDRTKNSSERQMIKDLIAGKKQ